MSTSVAINTADAAFDEFGPMVERPADQSAQQAQSIIDSTSSKSDKIRALLGLGWKRQAVADALGIRYQHVRNVELTPLKKKA